MIRRLRSWWRRRRRGPLIDEICHRCFVELHARDAWETREHLVNTAEMGPLGGSYLTGYWCRAHRPADAVRWRP